MGAAIFDALVHAPWGRPPRSEAMQSLVLLSLVTMTFVLPLRLADRGARAVLSAYALMLGFYTVLLRFGIQYL